MSSDESDTEAPGRSIAYPHVYPKWCSKQLSTFLWQLDPIIERIHTTLVGRRKRGNPLHIWPHTTNYNPAAVAPMGFPRNCYDKEWLDSLPPRSKASLQVKDVDYKFRDSEDVGP